MFTSKKNILAMKCIVLFYITSAHSLEIIEDFFTGRNFSLLDRNNNCGTFHGFISCGVKTFLEKLNYELSDVFFDPKDFIYLVTPHSESNPTTVSISIIKRKSIIFG